MAAVFGLLAFIGSALSPIFFIIVAALIFVVEIPGGLTHRQLAITGYE